MVKSPFLQSIRLPEIPLRENLLLLREDFVHPFAGGNKWRKLKYNLIDFFEQRKKVLLTFGGAFSNHLIATAAAGNQLGFQTIGIVRGEDLENPCLHFMREQGMKLLFVSREDYRQKNEAEIQSTWISQLIEKGWIKNESDVFILPEGGSNHAATLGTAEMGNEISDETIFCACGTGATVAGLSNGINTTQHIHAIPVLKAENFIREHVKNAGGDLTKITFHFDYHFGGYAKTTKELMNFCRDFYLFNQIQIEPVYTGKLLFALQDLLKKETFSPEQSITAIHTGGIYPFFPEF